MARRPRLVVPGLPHHVTQRGARRQPTFFEDADYLYYLKLLGEFSRKAATEIWAYCLMPNHVHLVMVPQHEDGLRAVLGETHRRYTRAVNFRSGWRGHLWQERFHSFVMDEAYLRATLRYVDYNPVAAGLCRDPTQWRWSSAYERRHKVRDGVVSWDRLRATIGEYAPGLAVDDDEATRDCIRKHSRSGRPLGDASFVARLAATTGRSLIPGRPGRRPTRDAVD